MLEEGTSTLVMTHVDESHLSLDAKTQKQSQQRRRARESRGARGVRVSKKDPRSMNDGQTGLFSGVST